MRRSAEKAEPVTIRRIHVIGNKPNERPSVMELPDYKNKLIEAATGSKRKKNP